MGTHSFSAARGVAEAEEVWSGDSDCETTGIEEVGERMLVQEVWQKKKVGVGGEVEEESGMQTFSLGQSTWKPVLRET